MQYLSFLCSEGRVFKNGVAGAFVGNVASSNWLKVKELIIQHSVH